MFSTKQRTYRQSLTRDSFHLSAILLAISLLALSLYSVAREASRLLEAVQ
jgi:hypothetical protein